MHTVNEGKPDILSTAGFRVDIPVQQAIRLDGFVDMVKFFSVLILNADESKTI